MPNRISRPATLDSESAALEGGRRLVRWDPTFNTGTVVQIVTIIVIGVAGVVSFRAELHNQAERMEMNRQTAVRDNANAVESLKEIKADVKDLRADLSNIKESLAILRGRAAESPSGRR